MTNNRKRRKPRRGSPRVAAWVHQVLNPWIDNLTTELGFLNAGNTTFRYWSQQLEFIRPLREYLPHPSWPTIDDLALAREKEEVQNPIDRHDRLQRELEATALHAWKHLTGSAAFNEEVDREMKQYAACLQSTQGADPTTGFDSKVVADRLVNNISNLPETYVDAGFWARTRTTLEHWRSGPVFQQLGDKIREVQDGVAEILGHFKILRFELVDEYDIPASPPWPTP